MGAQHHLQLASAPLERLVRTNVTFGIHSTTSKQPAFRIAKIKDFSPGGQDKVIIGPDDRTGFTFLNDGVLWWVYDQDRIRHQEFTDGVLTFPLHGKRYELHLANGTLPERLPSGLFWNTVPFKEYDERRKDVVAERLEERLLTYLPRTNVILHLLKQGKGGDRLRISRVDGRFVVAPEKGTLFAVDTDAAAADADIAAEINNHVHRRGRVHYELLLPEQVYEIHTSSKTLPKMPKDTVWGRVDFADYFRELPRKKRNGYPLLDVTSGVRVRSYSMQYNNGRLTKR